MRSIPAMAALHAAQWKPSSRGRRGGLCQTMFRRSFDPWRLRFHAIALLLLFLALFGPKLARAQQMIWTDTYNGGLVTGSFSIGDQSSGIGVLYMGLPPGATVRSAKLYAVAIGTTPEDSLSFSFGNIPVTFNASTAGPVFQSLYGPVVLHTVDLTATLDPTLPYHLIDLSQGWTNFKEFMLFTEYELPGMGPITVDVFHLGEDSQLEENYTIHASHPMDNGQPIAFGTMGAYACCEYSDYESVAVNGVDLGKYYGRDFNAGPGNNYGACATFHYANGTFEGRGDDSTDVAISGADVLSELSTLLPYGAQDVQLTYQHVPAVSPWAEDNIVNLAVLAYSSVPCIDEANFLGPDTVLCPGDTLLLNAYREGASYLWQDGSTQAGYTVTAPGTYVVQWSHPNCTYAPDTVVVGMVHLPSPALGTDRELCRGTSITLGNVPPPSSVVTWNDGVTDLPRTFADSGSYVVEVGLQGCTVRDSVQITLVDCPEDTIALPNVFTPNGEGGNNNFRPIILSGVASLHFTVFNRWGQPVFQTSRMDLEWDGRTGGGEPVPDGVYFWVLEFVPEHAPATRQSQHGTVTLLR